MNGGPEIVMQSPLGVAIVAGSISLFGLWLTSTWRSATEQRSRRREHFAEAFAAVEAYKEFPFAVRRRQATSPEAERIRLSEALRAIQADLAYRTGWLETESIAVADAYRILCRETRRTAGAAIRDAWLVEPCTTDAGMNLPELAAQLAPLAASEAAYLREVRAALSPWPRWLHRRLSRGPKQSAETRSSTAPS